MAQFQQKRKPAKTQKEETLGKPTNRIKTEQRAGRPTKNPIMGEIRDRWETNLRTRTIGGGNVGEQLVRPIRLGGNRADVTPERQLRKMGGVVALAAKHKSPPIVMACSDSVWDFRLGVRSFAEAMHLLSAFGI